MSEWIASVITAWGPLGVAFLMFLENVFPPIPSEVILPLAGVEAGRQGLSVVTMILAATAGSLAGLTVWYYAAAVFGKRRLLALVDRFGRILTMTEADIAKVEGWFARWGMLAVFFGRLVPTVRTLISVPAGFVAMPIGRFLLYSAAGSLLWSGALVLAGLWLGAQGGLIESLLGPVSDAVLVLIVAIWLWRVITFRRARG